MDKLLETPKKKAASSSDESETTAKNSSEEVQDKKSKEIATNDEGGAMGKDNKDKTIQVDNSKQEAETRRKSQRLSVVCKKEKFKDQESCSTTRKMPPLKLKDEEYYIDEDEDSASGDEENRKQEEERWEPVTPEMLMISLKKNSLWRSSSTVNEVVHYLRQNYPVCPDQAELTEEVANKLICAEEIGLVIKECSRDKTDPEKVVNKYRLASPLEKTYLSEWELKEFWSHYREILRRSKRQERQEKAKLSARMARRRQRGRARPRTSYSKNQRKAPRKYQYRRRNPYAGYSSDESEECGKDCCCRR